MERENKNILRIKGTVQEIGTAYKLDKFNEAFLRMRVEVPRLSEAQDLLPVIVSDKLLYDSQVKVGDRIEVTGQIRTRNFRGKDGKNHLEVFGYAQDIQEADEEDLNEVELEGYICKAPRNRTTANTGRVITDILLAVNRRFSRSDYIPNITWGKNAKFAAKLQAGDLVAVQGRFQSRLYNKRDSEESRMVYEVSVSNIELVKGLEENDEVSDS